MKLRNVLNVLFAGFFLVFLSSSVYSVDMPDDSGVNNGLNQSIKQEDTTLRDGSDVEELTDIIDIKPPVNYGWNARWILFLLLALTVILLAVAVLLFWKKRNRSKTGETSAPAEPEDVTALSALFELAAADNIQDRVFYFRLSAIIRAYLDGRFGLDTMEKTTEELLPVIKKLQIDVECRSNLAELLLAAEPVKFASVQAGQERRIQDLEFVESFIKITRRIVKNETDSAGSSTTGPSTTGSKNV